MVIEEQQVGLFSSLRSFFSAEKKKVVAARNNEDFVEEYVRPSFVGTEISTSEPMNTRTVMFEATEKKTTHNKESMQTPSENLDIVFAEKFIESGGKFMFCETIADAVEQVRLLAQNNEWSHVYSWENEIKDMFCENNFQKGAIGFTMEKSDAAASLCESLIAENGSLILNSKQSSRRRLPVFPKTQIYIAQASQVLFSLSQALESFSMTNKDELPSVLNLQANTKGNYYHDGQLVFKAEGSDDIYLILVDEVIPKSTRA